MRLVSQGNYVEAIKAAIDKKDEEAFLQIISRHPEEINNVIIDEVAFAGSYQLA